MRDFLKYTFTLVLILGITIIAYSIGANMASGKSAYDIAVEQGYSGSVDDWLTSLRGANGKDAPNIQALYDSAVEDGYTGDIYDFAKDTLDLERRDSSVFASNKAVFSAVSVYCTFAGNSLINGEYSGAGSGVIYSIDKEKGDAYILTNYHVVYESNSGLAVDIKAYLYGAEYSEYGMQATFVGGANDSDVAVLKISGSDVIKQSNAVAVKVADNVILGETAIAIGNPEAEGISVTKGVVSVLNENINIKSAKGSTVNLPVMRIDTAINSGNSGGGLFNDKSELIGLVNAKVVASGIEGVGYALPADLVSSLADCIIDTAVKGVANKCVLGVSLKVVSSKAVLDLNNLSAEIVQEIMVASGNGRLLEGDVIKYLTLNEKTINPNNMFDIQSFLYKARKGDTITIGALRNNNLVLVDIILNDVTQVN